MRTHFETPPVFGCSFRLYTHDGIKFYAGRKDRDGLEDCAELRIKSDNYDVRFAKENDDTFICPQSGETFRGKGGVSAQIMYARELRKRADLAASADINANTAKLAG
jgi:hypothetical protein|tara:strand:- start:647 stop:967 length:321 start_codon:yes stop_codon:yes gene_type:complete